MPGKIKVKILAGRNLPVMDRSGDTTDAYVEIKFGNTTYKTDVCRKSLNPQWNSEWYKFEVEDAELQDEPLQIRLMDHDTYSANDAIGKVYVNLNPLLLPGVPPPVKNIWTLEASINSGTGSQGGSVMTGWIPVYDTMHGIRGEVNIIVKVELFLDFNKFRQSSCGVTFFYSSIIPHGYHAQVIHGFVEELVVSDDPEYKWIDKIRTPRASNEARQTLFLKLSNEVQRKIGLKALDLGGNAVIGYLQNFDLEGESGIVARGIGTVVTLIKLLDFPNFLPEAPPTDDQSSAVSRATKPHQSPDCSESESSPRLPSRHHHHQHHHHHHQQHHQIRATSHSNVVASSPTISPTILGGKFPLYGENVPLQQPTPLKPMVECRPSAPLSRHASIQSWKSISSSKPNNVTGSNLSLADELVDEAASFRAMLALEDMRGEPQGNRFSRGLKNFRYNVLAKRGRRAPIDSLDDESSDLDSSHSSSWSICGSDSAANGARPQAQAVLDLRHNMRKKKLRHRKNSGENVAAMLIRSVHVGGLPLDIVKEDRETPTPSPVNLVDDASQSREIAPISELEKISESDSPSEKVEQQADDDGKSLPVNVASEKDAIPMISSSESDTSSSEGDREDDPSESSTNYNILDDTLSLLEPSSPEIESYPMLGDSPIKLHSSTPVTSFASQPPVDQEEQETKTTLLDLEVAEPPPVPPGTQTISIDEMLSSEFSSDVDSDLPVSAIPDDYRAKRTKKLPSPSRASKSMERERPKQAPESLPSHPGELVKTSLEHQPKFESPSLDNQSSSRASSKSRHRLLKQLSIVQKTESENSDSSGEEEEYYPKKQLRAAAMTKIQESKLLDDERRRDKSPRRVERTATVIYKGPKSLAEQTIGDSSSPPLTPVTPTAPLPKSPTVDANHLQIPSVKLKDIVPNSPMPPGGAVFDFSDDVRVASMMMKKYRRSCMLDLIKLIDSRMIAHHHSRSDSMRRWKHQVASPSPTSRHRRSRSRSPEVTSHHHSRHHQAPSRHHESSESLAGGRLTSTSSFEGKSGAGVKSLQRIASEDVGVEKIEMRVFREREERVADAVVEAEIRDVATKDCVSDVKIGDGLSATDDFAQLSSRQQEKERPEKQTEQSQQQATSPVHNNHKVVAQSPMTKNSGVLLHRRSSDSDLSITPKGNSLTGSDRSMGGYLKPSTAIIRNMNQEALEMLEYPFITMQQYPPGFVLHIGGLVSARSVKLLERVNNLEEPEGRDSWWTEIRMEVRSHARALACNVVIGYREETSICDDVCVLSVSGTAAVISLHSTGQDQDNVLITHVQGPMTASTESDKVPAAVSSTTGPTTTTVVCDKGSKISELPTTHNSSVPQSVAPAANSTHVVGAGVASTGGATVGGNSSSGASTGTGAARSFGRRNVSESNDHEPAYALASSACSPCHLPYNKASINFQVNVSKCAVCRRAAVPDVVFSTVELPEGVPMTGRGCLIQATVCKAKKDLRGELHAKEVSDCLPFLEYELHSLLLNKLRVRGMNAVFGIRSQLSIGERFIVGVIVGTAVYLTALPPPSPPQIARGNSWHDEEQIAEMQKCLMDTVRKNVEFYQLKPLPELENGRSTSDTDESEDELPELDLGIGLKDVCVLEVDDIEDLDRINLLLDDRPPNDFHVVNTETIPGLEDLEIVRNLQMFTQVSRAKIPTGQSASMPSKYFARLLQTVFFKLRRMVPCALCDLQFKISMPEQDEIQLSVVGMALGLGESTKCSKYRRKVFPRSVSKDQVKRPDENDMIFCLDEDHGECASGDISPNAAIAHNIANPANNQTLSASLPQKSRPRSPLRIRHTSHRHKHVPLKERYGVDITPLSYLPGGKIDRYLGNLNFFFIRESNSIRENGGLSGFIHSFVTEVLAILRAHVRALGGNAMVAFFMTQCVLLHSPHKNQGQCLINVGGDVVNVSYFGNDSRQQQPMNANGGNC